MSDPSRPALDASPEAPPVLSYRPPAEDALRVRPVVVGMTALGISVLVFSVVPGAVLLMLGVDSGWALLLIPALLATLIFLAIRCHLRRYRAAALGIWIGMGVGLLVEGLCFGIFLTR